MIFYLNFDQQKNTHVKFSNRYYILLAGSSSLIHHISLLLYLNYIVRSFFLHCLVFFFCIFLFDCFLILYGYVKYMGMLCFLLLIKRCLINWFHLYGTRNCCIFNSFNKSVVREECEFTE